MVATVYVKSLLALVQLGLYWVFAHMPSASCWSKCNFEQADPRVSVHLQSLPLAKVNITAEAVSLGFVDSKGQDTDCSKNHLRLRGQKLDLLLEFIQDAVAAKVSFLLLPHHLVRPGCLCIAQGALLHLYSWRTKCGGGERGSVQKCHSFVLWHGACSPYTSLT